MREDNGMCLWCGPHQHREGSLRWWWSADWDLKAGEKEHSQLSVQLEGSRKTLGLERARAERPSAGSAQRAVTFGKRRIKAVQLTLERHRFELHGSIYMLTVANKYCRTLRSTAGWNFRCESQVRTTNLLSDFWLWGLSAPWRTLVVQGSTVVLN